MKKAHLLRCHNQNSNDVIKDTPFAVLVMVASHLHLFDQFLGRATIKKCKRRFQIGNEQFFVRSRKASLLRGDVVLYVAQAKVKPDAEIAEKGDFGTETRLPIEVTAGSHAMTGRKPRQARKGATVAVLVVCRGEAWLSLVSAIFFREFLSGKRPFSPAQRQSAHSIVRRKVLRLRSNA